MSTLAPPLSPAERFLHPNSPNPHQYKYTPHPTNPIFASPYGPFKPIDPDLNVHDFCFPPDQPLPADHDLFVNAVTGETVTLHQFYSRVKSLSRILRHIEASETEPQRRARSVLDLQQSPLSDREDGEIMGFFSPNHIHYPLLAHACFRAELAFGGISPGSTPYELWWVLRKMQVTSLILHESLLSKLHEALKLGSGEGDELARSKGLRMILDPAKIVVLCDDPTLDWLSGYRTIESLVRRGDALQLRRAEPARRLRGGQRLAYLFQSSGTSGLPKAMMITHRNAIHSGLQGMVTGIQTANYVGVPPLTPHRVLGVVPAYHSSGMILWILRVNLSPATNILLPKWDLELALQTIQKYKITLLPLVPPLVRQLAQSPLTAKYDLSSVLSASSGAAYLPPDVAYQLAKKLPQGASAPIPSGYGLSEAASIASPAAPGIFGLPEAKPGTIGYLLPGMRARVVDPDTLKDVKRGEKGELWAMGPVVTPGYFKDESATREILVEDESVSAEFDDHPPTNTNAKTQGQRGVWLRTGDLVLRDENDRIHYLDRLKEMIKVKGLQVAATEVEDCLLDHPDHLVRDACVAGVDNGRGDGSLFVRAWVVLTPEGERLKIEEKGRIQTEGEGVLEKKLATWIEGRLSRHKWLTGGIEVVESIPRTPSGKMLRREMRDRYHERVKREAGGRGSKL